MANETGSKGLPIPYITAVWSGMTADELQAGLAAGTILAPSGAPAVRPPVGTAFPEPIDARTAARESAANATDPAATPVTLRARIDGWLRALDPTLTDGAIETLWQRLGSDDAMRGTAMRQYLGAALLGDAGASEASLDAFVAAPGHRARLVDLHGMTGTELAALAATDIGYRQALAARQPFALIGNRALHAAANAEGALDRFDPDTGEALVSDAWLADRGKLLAWQESDASERVIVGNEDWTFIDRASPGPDGAPSTFELVTGKPDAGKNQVVFGHAGDELLAGVGGSDRMYGGAGHDILRGAGGGDHLEGGRGDDLVLGGAGDDELTGDQGADELDGGRGDDRLTGGSGDDLLVGGRGDDRLEGGVGTETYVIDAGDGRDTIIDADGKGSIELDGVRIDGAMNASGTGTWVSADGRLELSFEGEIAVPGTLTITALRDGDAHGTTPVNVITVKDWKNGDLGITLAGTSTANTNLDSNNDAVAITGPEVPVLSEADFEADVESGEAGDADAASAEADMNSAIAWGDVAPVGAAEGLGTTNGAGGAALVAADANPVLPESTSVGSEAFEAEVDSPADATPAASAEVVAGGPEDVDASWMSAFAAIFGADSAALGTVEPTHVESAIRAFSGVLDAPDVTASVDYTPFEGMNAVTAHDYADALAADDAGDDVGNETALLLSMPTVPDLKWSEGSGAAAALLRGAPVTR